MINFLTNSAGAGATQATSDSGGRSGLDGLASDWTDRVFGRPIADVAAEVAAEAERKADSETMQRGLKEFLPKKPLGDSVLKGANEALKDALPPDERLAFEMGGEKGLKEYQAIKPLLPEWARNPVILQQLEHGLERWRK